MTIGQMKEAHERFFQIFTLSHPFQEKTKSSFKIVIWFFLLILILIKIILEYKKPSIFAFLLVCVGFLLFIEIITKCFDFVNSRIGEKYWFAKSFLIFIILIIITFY